MKVTVRRVAFDDPRAVRLMRRLRAELADRYADVEGAFPTSMLRAAQFEPPAGLFVLAWDQDGRLIGCGGVRAPHGDVAEIKRMFVVPEARGSRAARAMLSALEDAAMTSGYRSVRLETGVRQPEAMRLYERSGYRRVPCYGEFGGNPLSACFERSLLIAGDSGVDMQPP